MLVTTKFLTQSVQPFDVYWIQTDRQTDRQAKYIFRYKRNILARTLLRPAILNKIKEKVNLDNLHINYYVYCNEIRKLGKFSLKIYFWRTLYYFSYY